MTAALANGIHTIPVRSLASSFVRFALNVVLSIGSVPAFRGPCKVSKCFWKFIICPPKLSAILSAILSPNWGMLRAGPHLVS